MFPMRKQFTIKLLNEQKKGVILRNATRQKTVDNVASPCRGYRLRFPPRLERSLRSCSSAPLNPHSVQLIKSVLTKKLNLVRALVRVESFNLYDENIGGSCKCRNFRVRRVPIAGCAPLQDSLRKCCSLITTALNLVEVLPRSVVGHELVD